MDRCLWRKGNTPQPLIRYKIAVHCMYVAVGYKQTTVAAAIISFCPAHNKGEKDLKDTFNYPKTTKRMFKNRNIDRKKTLLCSY